MNKKLFVYIFALVTSVLCSCAHESISNLEAEDIKYISKEAKADGKEIITCEGKVISFYEEEVEVFDASGVPFWDKDYTTVIKINRPKEWQGHILEVYSSDLHAAEPLRKREGKTIRFRIAKLYLVKEYIPEPDNGLRPLYIAYNDKLEILE